MLEGNLGKYSSKVHLSPDGKTLFVNLTHRDPAATPYFAIEIPLPVESMSSDTIPSLTPKRKRKGESVTDTKEEDDDEAALRGIKRTRIEESEEITINSLPHEVLEHIFLHLPLQTAGTVNAVCRTWHTICDTDSYWRRLFGEQFGSPPIISGTWKEKMKIVRSRWTPTKSRFPEAGPVYWATALGFEVTKRTLKDTYQMNWLALGCVAGFSGNLGPATYHPEVLDNQGQLVTKPYVEKVVLNAIHSGNLLLYTKVMDTVGRRNQFGGKAGILTALIPEDPLIKAIESGCMPMFEKLLDDLVTHVGSTPFGATGKWRKPLDRALCAMSTAHAAELLLMKTRLDPYRKDLNFRNYPIRLEVVHHLITREGAKMWEWWLYAAYRALEDTKKRHLIIPFINALIENKVMMDEEGDEDEDWTAILDACIPHLEGTLWRSWVYGDVKDPEDEEQNPVLKCLRNLLKHMVSIGVSLGSSNALELAVEGRCPLWGIRTLIELGHLQVNDYLQSMPPLMIAVKQQRKDVVQLFLGAGADVTVKDRQGMDALMLAVQGRDWEMLELLREWETVKK